MEDISIVNPYIRVAMQSVLKKGTHIASRVIFDYELLYVADGAFVLHYNGIDHICQKGQFVLLCPGISHSFSGIDSDLSQPHIHFDITHMPNSDRVPVCFKDIQDLTEHERKRIREDIFGQYPQNPFVVFGDQKTALDLFYRIINQPKLTALAQKGMLIQLLDLLIADNFPGVFETRSHSTYSIEAQIKDYLDAGQGLVSNLDDLAHQFNYSKYHLERCFKDRYGVGLISYRNDKRMQLAKTILQTETVSTTAEKLGFSSIYVFSRAFKNYFGVSPSAFKKAR